MSKRIIRSIVALLLSTLLLSARPAKADTDIKDFLNSVLVAKKIMVSRTRQIKYYERECDIQGERIFCYPVERIRDETYSDNARVQTPQVLSVQSLKFDQADVKSLPATVLINREDYFNCGTDMFTISNTLSVSGTRGWSTTKSKTIGSSTTVSLNKTFTTSIQLAPGITVGENTSIGVSETVSLSDTTSSTESYSVTDTRSFAVSVSISPKHAGFSSVIAYQAEIEVPFSAVVVVDGSLESNNSGYTNASQLLSQSERTLPFSGSVRAQGLSAAQAGNYPPQVPLNCNDPKYKGKELITPSQHQIPASTLSPEFAASFGSWKRTTEVTLPSPPVHGQGGNIIALDSKGLPPTGLSYTAIASSTVLRADPKCGFDDAGMPKPAKYSSELRRYSDFLSGELTDTWEESVEAFSGCTVETP